MSKSPLSVTIITLNEEEKIRAAIESVNWADDIVVVDSGSQDRTVEIAKELGARVFHHPWSSYGAQKNYAQSLTKHDWVLNIDADERVSQELAEEVRAKLNQILTGKTDAMGFYLPRKTYYIGQWIKYGGWYPNHLTRLANKKSASWSEPHVHEQLVVHGKTELLHNALDHDAFSSIQDQILTNLKFSRLGSQDLAKSGRKTSVLKLILKPMGKFLETYILKRGFMDGLAGFIISVNAAHSMFLKYAYLHEGKIRKARR